jgi:hypothetical protein
MAKEPKKRKRRAAAARVTAQSYVPTDKERAALSRLIDRIEQVGPLAAAKVEVDKACVRLSWNHQSQAVGAVLWANALGTSDLRLAGTIFEQLAQIARTGAAITEAELNGVLAIVRGLAPTDSTEALLAAQMAAVHSASMVAARRLVHAETLAQQDSASTMFNKLARTFVAQVEGLKRYRLKGEQTIKVQHVTVNDGGQAIVGDVQHTNGGSPKNGTQSLELATPDASVPALLGHFQANGQVLPSAGGEGKAGVPLPRRSRRSSQRRGQRRLSPRPLHQ